MSKIEKIIEKNIQYVPFEGNEIDKEEMTKNIKSLLKGMVTFSHSYTKTTSGYEKDGKIYSRNDIVEHFIESMKI